MSHFPVSSSNLAAQPLGIFIQQQYQLQGEIQCKLIRSGINDTYLVQTPDHNYIFRVYSLHWRTELEIMEELRLLNLLKDNHISVSYPFVDKDNRYLQQLQAPEGLRYGVLFSYAKGEKLHQFSHEVHFNIGQLMAQLHKVTEHLILERVTYTSNILITKPLTEQISRFLSADCAEMHYLKSTAEYLVAEFEKLDVTQLRTGAVHLDIWFENLNVTPDNQITIFDFDFCGNGFLCLDLAYYMLQVYSTENGNREKSESKLASFWEGYEAITPIGAEEKRILPMLGLSLYIFYLGIQCQRFENWSNSFLSENYLKRFINGLVKRYDDIHQINP